MDLLADPLSFVRGACALAVAAFAVPLCLFAQQNETEADFGHELSPLEVTAAHFPELAVKVPSQVSILQGAELDRFAPISLPEILAREPGIVVRSFNGSPASATIDLRGLGVTAGQRVLILVNGRRLNRPDLGQINWLQIPAYLIERVEILKGGQSVIHGDNAVGGVIKITTRKNDAEGGEVAATVGGHGLVTGHAAASRGGSSHDAFFSASAYQEDGYRDRSAAEATSAGGQLNYRLSEHWESTTSLRWTDSEMELPGALYSIGFPGDPTAAGNPADVARQTNWTLDQQFSSELPGGVQFQFDFNVERQDIEFELFASGDAIIDSVSLRPRALFDAVGVQWTTGADFVWETLDFTGYESREREISLDRAELDRRSIGAYLYGVLPISETLELRAGARQQWFETKAARAIRATPTDAYATDYDGNLNADLMAATVGLNFRPWHDLRLWTRYDRIFRFPLTDEIASYQGFALPVPFNENLDAEKGNSLEFGGQWSINRWELQGTLFYLALEDEITFDSTLFQNVNKPGSERLGAEVSIVYRQESYTLSLGWMGLDAEITEGDATGNRPALTPKNVLTAQVLWRPVEFLDLGATYRYLSEQYEESYLDRAAFSPDGVNPDPILPSSSVVDLHASFALGEQLSLRLIVNNITDERYATYKVYGGWYPAPGRTARAQFAYRF